MKPEFIKPIPKYIREQIYKLDLKECPKQENYPRFYSYLAKVQGELVKVTVAVINYYKKWCCKQVFIHGVKSGRCLKRDIKYSVSMYGRCFKVGWYAEGYTRRTYAQYFEQGWQYSKFNSTYPCTKTINPEFVEKFKDYQHSAYQKLDGDCIVAYLKLYEQYPQTEYLLKFGLSNYRYSISIVKRIGSSKKFRKWFVANKDELAKGYQVPVIYRAFKTGKTLEQAKRYIDSWHGLRVNSSQFTAILEMFKDELEQLCAYLQNQDSDPSSYLDYLNACNYLRLDMSRQDNRYPSDFQRWHDRRIEEYITVKKRADEKKRAELYKQFAAVAEKYQDLQRLGSYAVIIAKSPAELIHEGEQLRHCVGKMSYEEKMAKEETLIFFVRSIEQPNVPFVTIEYSLASNKILQCYGYQSQRPDDYVMDFVNKVWLPYANRTIKKLCA